MYTYPWMEGGSEGLGVDSQLLIAEARVMGESSELDEVLSQQAGRQREWVELLSSAAGEVEGVGGALPHTLQALESCREEVESMRSVNATLRQQIGDIRRFIVNEVVAHHTHITAALTQAEKELVEELNPFVPRTE